MIIQNDKKYKSFDEISLKITEKFNNNEDIAEYVQALLPTIADLSSFCACPKCGAIDRFSSHAKYQRNIVITLVSDNISVLCIINRVICNSCKATHALLPDFLVPYKIFTNFSILDIVSFASKYSVLKAAEKFNVSFQLIYSFIKLILDFIEDLIILNQIKEYYDRKTFNKLFLLTNCFEFFKCFNVYFDYFKIFNWIIFMTKFRNINSSRIFVTVNF